MTVNSSSWLQGRPGGQWTRAIVSMVVVGLVGLMIEEVMGRMGERGVVGCWSSLVGRGPQVTLRVLCKSGVEVGGSGVVFLESVGCCVVVSGCFLTAGGGRIGPLRMGWGLRGMVRVGVL